MVTRERAVALVTALLLAAGCGDEGPAGPGDGAVTIGPSGGVISSADGAATLTIPAGALASSEEITVRRIADPSGDGDALPGTRYDFGPDGLRFDVPATLTISYDTGDLRPDVSAAEAPYEVVVVRDEGGEYSVQPGTNDVSAGIVTAELRGFSEYHATASATIFLPPAQLRVTGQTASSIELTFNPPSPIPELAAGIGDFPESHYYSIERAVGSQSPPQADDRFVRVATAGPFTRSQIATGPLTFTDEGLTPEVDDRIQGSGPQSFFTYRVRSTDGIRFGQASDPATGFILGSAPPVPETDGSNLLVDPSFETLDYRTGISPVVPAGTGYWQGDLATVVEGTQADGVMPGDGSRTLRCDATGPFGGSVEFSGCEALQIIDVSGLAAPIDSTLILMSASFLANRVALDAETDQSFLLSVYALSGPASNAPSEWTSPLDSWDDRLESDGDTGTWEELSLTKSAATGRHAHDHDPTGGHRERLQRRRRRVRRTLHGRRLAQPDPEVTGRRRGHAPPRRRPEPPAQRRGRGRPRGATRFVRSRPAGGARHRRSHRAGRGTWPGRCSRGGARRRRAPGHRARSGPPRAPPPRPPGGRSDRARSRS